MSDEAEEPAQPEPEAGAIGLGLLTLEPSEAEYEAIDQCQRIVFLGTDYAWRISTQWLIRMSTRYPSETIRHCVRQGFVTFVYIDGDRGEAASRPFPARSKLALCRLCSGSFSRSGER